MRPVVKRTLQTVAAAIYPAAVFLFVESGTAALELGNNAAGWRITLSDEGRITEANARFGNGWERIDFRSDEYGGPCWYGKWDGECQKVDLKIGDRETALFEGRRGALKFSLRYRLEGDCLLIEAGIRNDGKSVFTPVKAGLKLGIDCYMEKFPEWNQKFFPTLLRCEKTHLWGYFMTPSGRLLGVVSYDPIASWSLDYKQLLQRIYTANLDLLNASPLPDRHPKHLSSLEPREEISWQIYLKPIEALTAVKEKLAEVSGAPMIEIDRYTVEPGESVAVSIHSGSKPEAIIETPEGGRDKVTVEAAGERLYGFDYLPKGGPGVYTLTEEGDDGKRSEAKIFVRRPWSWYLKGARREALRVHQKAAITCESFYGFYSLFSAAEHFPDRSLDARAKARFEEIFPIVFDPIKLEPTEHPTRIQNTATMCGILVDRYRATGEEKHLETAAELAEYVLKQQAADGSIRGQHGSHYTSVIYLAKSIMELMAEEAKLMNASAVWRERYEGHHRSVKAAVEDLARRRGDIGTEGEQTFEDGMISCSATQLSMYALLHAQAEERARYTEAAEHYLLSHRCLDQLLIPDCRMRGGTLRFWESQYDVKMQPNMMNSPHGWTAWKIYGLWYLYQITGKTDYLYQAMNALGACAQLTEVESGRLRWAFVPDPFVEAKVWVRNHSNPEGGRHVDRIIGEQYVEMVGDWYPPGPYDRMVDWWGANDNNVHEIFKAIEEVALKTSCVLERADGRIEGFNCRVQLDGRRIAVEPSEAVVDGVHFNLRSPREVTVLFTRGPVRRKSAEGLGWIRRP